MAAEANQPQRDDELQRKLRDRGYLANPLEKFFIGGSRGRAGVLVANLKIAAKVGVLGGIFLGVVTALGLAVLSPEMFPSWAAAAKLTLYFAVVFTALFAAMELVICLVATILGRALRRLFTRTEMIALYSGVFAALVVLVYGTLWWWAAQSRGEVLSARAAAAFAVIALVAAAVGALTRLAVRALLILLGGADLAEPGKGRATRLYVVILVFGIVFFAGWRLATARPAPMEPTPYEVRPTGLSVSLVAIDGGSIEFLDYARDKGIAPNLSALADKGFLAPLAEPPLHVNPAVWTTVATGVEPDKHGVTSYSAQEIPGLAFYIKDRVGFGLYDALLAALPAVGLTERAPLERRGMTFPAAWDILAQKGDLSGVVNWWGTWPADSFHGFLVTDRMYPKLQAARVSGTAGYEAETYPEILFGELKGYALTEARIADDPFAAAADMDRFAVSALAAGRREYEKVALEAVYLAGLDVYENAAYRQSTGAATAASAARLADGVSRYWTFLDTLLAPILAQAGPDRVVIVVADPGMLKPHERRVGRRSTGFALLAGGPVRVGGSEGRLSLVDITPAAMYLLGYPVSAEMDGRVPAETFEKDFTESHPVRSVPTFGRLEVKAGGVYSVGGELVDRLRSLGYLQ